jgi:hypothetical protein
MLKTFSKLIKKKNFKRNYKDLLSLTIFLRYICVAIKELQEQK